MGNRSDAANAAQWAGLLLAGAVAAVLAASLVSPVSPPDFAGMQSVSNRKQAFFDYLQPLVEARNAAILVERRRVLEVLEEVRSRGRADWLARGWLAHMFRRYDVDVGGKSLEASLQTLLRRVDIIPVSLVLVQAAKESAWGTSRFARLGNNFFGHQCFEEGCGFVPQRRARGRVHEVARFLDAGESVSKYLLNLNTRPEYRRLRNIRQRLRRENRPVTGLALADGLQQYSERRGAYVAEIKSMIRENGLEAATTSG